MVRPVQNFPSRHSHHRNKRDTKHGCARIRLHTVLRTGIRQTDWRTSPEIWCQLNIHPYRLLFFCWFFLPHFCNCCDQQRDYRDHNFIPVWIPEFGQSLFHGLSESVQITTESSAYLGSQFLRTFLQELNSRSTIAIALFYVPGFGDQHPFFLAVPSTLGFCGKQSYHDGCKFMLPSASVYSRLLNSCMSVSRWGSVSPTFWQESVCSSQSIRDRISGKRSPQNKQLKI